MSTRTSNSDRLPHQAWDQEQVRATVAASFPACEHEAVLRELAKYKGHSLAGRARVQLTILQVASGSAPKVVQLIHFAVVEFRAFPSRSRAKHRLPTELHDPE